MIMIYGYNSYAQWVEAGCPGAVSFYADGSIKDTTLAPPISRRGSCVDCGRSVVVGPRCVSCGASKRALSAILPTGQAGSGKETT